MLELFLQSLRHKRLDWGSSEFALSQSTCCREWWLNCRLSLLFRFENIFLRLSSKVLRFSIDRIQFLSVAKGYKRNRLPKPNGWLKCSMAGVLIDPYYLRTAQPGLFRHLFWGTKNGGNFSIRLCFEIWIEFTVIRKWDFFVSLG